MAFAYCERSNGLLIRCKNGGRRGAHSQSLPKCEGSARPVPLGFAFPFGTGEMLTDCARSASGLRWLVLMQQVMGQFPFAWPSPGEGKGAPEFSVPLFLWTLALQVARVSAAALQNFVAFATKAISVECLYSYLYLPTCTHKKHTCLDISISAVSTFQCSPILSRTPFKLTASLTSKIYTFLPLVSLSYTAHFPFKL